ncbi:MAG: gamma-glutamyltransferase [Acidobacteriota bacterium]
MSASEPTKLMACAALLLAANLAGAADERPAQLRAIEVRSERGVVVAGHAAAAEAGARVLAEGGNAIDAAVVTALAMGSADPASSGIGGQTYLLLHLRDGRDIAIDGSALVPLGLSRPQLQALAASSMVAGPRCAAAPGTLAALAHALERHGTVSLRRALEPAIEIAESGATLPAFQVGFLESYLAKLRADPAMATIWLRSGFDPWDGGHRYCHDALAATLRRIAAGGAREFYAGGIAAEIDADMAARGGFLRRTDLALVRAVERKPERVRYRDVEVVTFPAPGGGPALSGALAILAEFPPALAGGEGTDSAFLRAEVCRVAMLDADAAALHPLAGGPNRAQARARAARIRLDRVIPENELNAPGTLLPWDRDTTHLSVADAEGNVVSLTQTIGRSFGAATATVGLGFPYNSVLEAGATLDDARAAVVRPGGAVRTTMAPTIVLRDGRPWLALGGVGSGRIVPSIVEVLTRVVDAGAPLIGAMAAPRVLWGHETPRKIYAEMVPPVTGELVDDLVRRGFTDAYRLRYPGDPINVAALGGVNALLVEPRTGLSIGVADPRRDGAACAPPR